MKDGDRIVFSPEDELYTLFHFKDKEGNTQSMDAVLLVKSVPVDREDDAGYMIGRFVIFQTDEGFKMGTAPADADAGMISKVELAKMTYYMTLGEFNKKFPGATNLLNKVKE